ncbi:MAG: ABC transporter ATP-binding protein [Eubacteriales bacterium]|nr:ABC transporter ATP-binding protein [Eubacteriales bacterium]
MKRYIRPQVGLLVLAVLFSLLSGGSAILVQFTKGSLLDQALAGLSNDTIRYIILLLGIIFFEIFCYHLFNRFRGRYFVCAKSQLREDFFAAQLRKTPPQMMGEKQGDILAAYIDQIDLASNSYLLNLPLLFDVILKIILVSSALFWLDVRVAVLTVLLLTTPLYVPKLIEGRLQKAQKASTTAFQEHLGKITEWLGGFELIKNYGAERPIRDLFLKSNRQVREKDYAMRKMSYVSRSLSALLSYLSHFIILAYSAWLVLEGSFTAGSFLIAVGMIDQLSYPIISISLYLQEMTASRPVINKLLAEIDAPAEENTPKSDPGKPLDISFDNIYFTYPSGKSILNNLNFYVAVGEKCLITGPSGGGKTTLINLLMGYYALNQGSLTLGGIEATNVRNLNGLITIMRQDPSLFNDTLRNNLSLYQNIQDDDMIKMLKNLNLHDFANPVGLDSLIQEGGSNLSGGERKRICLARTLLRGSPIVILDEPLANVDPETAVQIARLIASLEGVTLFVISHQQSPDWANAFEHHLIVGTNSSGATPDIMDIHGEMA